MCARVLFGDSIISRIRIYNSIEIERRIAIASKRQSISYSRFDYLSRERRNADEIKSIFVSIRTTVCVHVQCGCAMCIYEIFNFYFFVLSNENRNPCRFVQIGYRQRYKVRMAENSAISANTFAIFSHNFMSLRRKSHANDKRNRKKSNLCSE